MTVVSTYVGADWKIHEKYLNWIAMKEISISYLGRYTLM